MLDTGYSMLDEDLPLTAYRLLLTPDFCLLDSSFFTAQVFYPSLEKIA